MIYNRKCLVCGKENRGLYLDETGGRMTCESCGADIQFRDGIKTKWVPDSARKLMTRGNVRAGRNEQ